MEKTDVVLGMLPAVVSLAVVEIDEPHSLDLRAQFPDTTGPLVQKILVGLVKSRGLRVISWKGAQIGQYQVGPVSGLARDATDIRKQTAGLLV